MSAVLSVQFRRGGIWHALRDEDDARTACGRVVRAQQRRQPMWDWATHRAVERCVHCERSLSREEGGVRDAATANP